MDPLLIHLFYSGSTHVSMHMAAPFRGCLSCSVLALMVCGVVQA